MIRPKVPKPTPAESRRAYELVRERSFGVCEICGRRRATEVHHRLYRSQGGVDLVENLLHVCGLGNHTGCHGDAHSDPARYTLGWALRSGTVPAVEPLLYRGRPATLTTDGGVAYPDEVPRGLVAAGGYTTKGAL